MNDSRNDLGVFKQSKFRKVQKYLKSNRYLLAAVVLVSLLLLIVIAYQIVQRGKSTTNAVANTAEFEPDNHIIKTDNVVADVAGQESVIEWKQSVKPSESLEDLPIDGVIYEKIDESQEFQDDSLELPDGWTGQWTSATPTNGQTEKDLIYQDFPTPPAVLPTNTKVTYLKITTGTSDSLKPNVQTSIIEPVNMTALDRTGYTPSAPVLYNKKIYQVMMAVNVTTNPSKYTIDCYDLETYAKCDGYPSYMSSVTNSDLGTGTKDIRTAMNMQIILDDGQFGNEGRMYVPAQQGNNYGVACVDLKSKKNCGFTSMGTSAAPTGTVNPALVSGFVRSGDRFYGHANDADSSNQTVVCFDMDIDGQGTDGLCPEFTATTNAAVQTYDISKHSGSYQTFNLPIMSGTKLFWIVAYRHTATDVDVDLFEAGNPSLREQSDRGNVLTCFDTATLLPCVGPGNNSGWSHVFGGITSDTTDIGTENVKAYATFIWKKPGNVDHGICKLSGFGNGIDPSMICFYIDSGLTLPNVTGERSPPSFLPLQWLSVPWTFGPNINTIVDSQGSNRSYFPIYTTYYPALDAVSPYLAKLKGATICYDWDTQDLCKDFAGGRIRYWHEINDGDSATVGYLYDGQCMWAAGYYGDLWSFDPDNGLIPCRTSKTKLDISATGKKFYCDGVVRAFNWDRVRLSKSNMYDYEKFDVKITDGNGNIIDQGNIRETGYLNITTGYNNSNNPDNDTNGYKNLELEVNPKVLNTSPWANGSKPQISAILDAEPVQYCYKTKVKNHCDISSVSAYSKAELTTETDIISTNLTTNVPVEQEPEEQCFRDLKTTVTPNKTLVSNDELITYTINVQNKANKDFLEGRGDIPNALNPETATLEATIPAGMTFISADNGGVQQGNKVVWTNQSYPAAEVKPYSVVLQAPSSVIGQSKEVPKKQKVYAATSQTPLTMQATIIYGDDYFPSDNTASNTSAVFANTTIPPNVAPTVLTSISDAIVTAPASFSVDSSANDSDGSITKIEILQNGDVAKTCINISNCTLSALGYSAGTYNFSSKAYDNASPSLSTVSDVKTVTVSNPAVAPPVGNSMPNITMVVSDKSVTEPGKFKIDVSASDTDGSITKIEINQNGSVEKTCENIATCELEASGYSVGSYSFSAKAYDNANPAGTSTTETQVLEVLATSNSGGGIVSTDSQSNPRRRTAIESIASIPQFIGEKLGVAITVSARAVKPIPPSVARAIPFTTISLIIVFALFYFYQAYNQARSQLMLTSLAKRFKKTKENRKNYINLTSHYISTPITTMSSTIELQESLKVLPQKFIDKAKLLMAKLSEDSQNLLNNSQLLSDEGTSLVQKLDQYSVKNIIKNPRFIAPLIGVVGVVLISNIVFIRADKYSASIVTFVLQSSFFIIAVGSLVAGYGAMKKQKHAYALANQEFEFEQEINNAQSKFISDASIVLSKDVLQIDSIAPEIASAKHGDNFKSGLKSLKKAVSKLAYLDQLTASTIKKHPVPVNLETLTDEVFTTYRPIALQSQINLRTDIDSKAHAMVDSQGFKYILISLLDNAIKFTKPGGDIKVTIKDMNKRYVALIVQDTGAGIPKDKIDTLFAPFSRGTDTLKFNYEGLGLDLYMDKLISEQAGGTISISSIEGAYTTVSVKLPKK